MGDSMDVDSVQMTLSHTPPSCGLSPDSKKSRFHSPIIQNAYDASTSKRMMYTPVQKNTPQRSMNGNRVNMYGGIGTKNSPSDSLLLSEPSIQPYPETCPKLVEEKERRLANSTSSIFASSTISNPNADQIILCLSAVLKIQMDHDRDAPMIPRNAFSYFDDNVDEDLSTYDSNPSIQKFMYEGDSVDDIYAYIYHIYFKAAFSPECCIIALVYLNRIISGSNMPLNEKNWRSLVLSSLILAQKVWDDKSWPTSYFTHIIPIYSKHQIHNFERRFLELLEYQANVKQSLYARYYFELRELYEQLMKERMQDSTQPVPIFPLQPLKLWKAQQLEMYSDSFRLQHTSGSQRRDHRGNTTYPSSATSTPSQTLEDATYIPKGRFVQS